MEHWQIAAEEAKKRREYNEKWPLAGKKARRKGKSSKYEEGIIVVDKFEITDDMSPSMKKFFERSEDEYFIKFSQGDSEQLIGLPFEIWDEEKQKWIEEH